MKIKDRKRFLDINEQEADSLIKAMEDILILHGLQVLTVEEDLILY